MAVPVTVTLPLPETPVAASDAEPQAPPTALPNAFPPVPPIAVAFTLTLPPTDEPEEKAVALPPTEPLPLLAGPTPGGSRWPSPPEVPPFPPLATAPAEAVPLPPVTAMAV